MIDRDLRRTFVAHEWLTPDPAAVASRIAVGIARRHRRRRVAALTVAAVAVLALGGAIPAVVSRVSMVPVDPGVPTSSAPLPSPSTSSDSYGLVPAPPVEVVIPMSPGWLPDDVRTPTYTYTQADLTDGSRTLAYEARPEVTGVESVTVTTRVQAPEVIDPAAEGGYPSWVSSFAKRSIEVRGQPAEQTVTTSVSVGGRSCIISWREPSGLYVMTVVNEKTTSVETTCDIGERFARELKAEPMPLKRTVTLGLVPEGYELVMTGTNQEIWCPPGRRHGGCIEVQDGQNYDAPENSTPVTVRGHQGYLARGGNGVLLLVPGFVRLSVEPGVPASVDTTEGLVRLAESAVLDRWGW